MSPNDTAHPAVLITGASTGIGAACALKLAGIGLRVFAGVRSDDAGRKLLERAKIEQVPAENITPVLIDVTDAPSIAAAAAAVADLLGSAGLAGLVNNAGIAVAGPLEIVPIPELRKQFEVNAIGVVAVTQAFLPLLRRAKGRIVNISSVSGGLASPYLGPYCASKFAVEAITDSLRQELRNWGIHVAAVEPGPINTPIWEKSENQADDLRNAVSPQKLDLYRTEIDLFQQSVIKASAAAAPVELVVNAVVHALTAKKPKTRYFLGWSVRVCFKGMKMLSDRIRDWIVRKVIGLP